MESRPVKIFPFIKSPQALALFIRFIAELRTIYPITIHAHKTVITIINADKRIAYLTYAGKNFIDIVFPFKHRYKNNLCFRRIQEVPGRHMIYHHFRMVQKEDINDEVRKFMRIAYER